MEQLKLPVPPPGKRPDRLKGSHGYQRVRVPEPKTYTGLYRMHKYWSRKPSNIVRAFVQAYTRPGDIVLDPFCGSGITAIESILTGRKAIAIDLNPMATFITRMSLLPVDLERLRRAFDHLRDAVRPKIDALYQTTCATCGKKAKVTHTIWTDGEPTKIWYQCPACKTKKGTKGIDPSDHASIARFEELDPPFWYPTDLLIENSRINVRPGQTVADLFSPRNLFALSLLFEAIERIGDPTIRDALTFSFTAALPQASKMVFVIKRRGRMNRTDTSQIKEEVGSWVIGYWIPKEHFEINVWRCFENAFNRVVRGKRTSNEYLQSYYQEASTFADLLGHKTALVLTQTATDLSNIPDNSIDYVFTDPPHGDRIPYFELSLLWASWLRLPIDFENEIVISDARQREKGVETYKRDLHASFREIGRVLKAGKTVSFAFNNLDDDTWLAILDLCSEVGFEIHDVIPMKYSASSVVQDSRNRGLKSDFVISCRNTKVQQRPSVNKWVEGPDSIGPVVERLIDRAQIGDGGIETYELLNHIIPHLIAMERAFRISDILDIVQTTLVSEGSRWCPRKSSADQDQQIMENT